MKLREKYTNLKSECWRITDKVKSGSGLAPVKDSKCFAHLNEILPKQMKNWTLLLNLVMFHIHKIQKCRPEVFCKKGIFRNFAKFIGKHMCQSLVFNIFAGWGEISKKTFSYRTSALAASENMQDTDDEKFQIHQTLIFPTIRRVYDGYDDSELNNEANEQLGFCRDKTATLWKKRLWHRCFPVKFVKFLRSQNNFFSWNRKILSFFT